MAVSPKVAQKILARRARSKITATAFKLEEYLFKEQLDFVTDPRKFVTACCSVRSGKTTSCAADLMSTALTMPGTVGLYITLARSSAKKIVWPELKHINKIYGLRCKFNQVELSVTFPNGSRIYCSGANTESEIDKVRGLSNVALAYIDESQSFRQHIKELVEDIITKRLYDTNGRCRLIGTPGPVMAGYYYNVCHNDTWGHHTWTMHQNPWLLKKSGKTPDELIAQDCRARGCTIDDPSIQRECLGRWVYDPNSLLLQYSKEMNDYDNLPPGVYRYILGVDLGVKDSDSLSLLAFKENDPCTYLVEEIVTPNQKVNDLVAQIQSLMKNYPIWEMPVDAGGLGLKVVEDMKDRFNLPLTPADKSGKMGNYKFLNNALRTGMFKAKHTSRFAQDCNTLEIDRNKSTPDRQVVKGHSDAVDSCLYAFKLSPAYNYTPLVPSPKLGTDEYSKQQEELHLQSAMEQVQRAKDLAEGKSNHYGWIGKNGKSGWNDW